MYNGSKILHLWRAWRQLDRRERRTYFAAALATPVLAGCARLLPLKTVVGLVSLQKGLERDDASAAPAMRRCVRALNRVARYGPYPGKCLSRSLALIWLLRRHRIGAHLHLGVRLIDGRLDAHAWVECDGVALNERPEVAEQFTEFGPLATGT
jgi:hypothetical protein